MSLASGVLEVIISGFQITSVIIKRELTLLGGSPLEKIRIHLGKLANPSNLEMVIELDIIQQENLVLVLVQLCQYQLIDQTTLNYLCTQHENLNNLARIVRLLVGYDLGVADYYRRLLSASSINLREIYNNLSEIADARSLNHADVDAALPELRLPVVMPIAAISPQAGSDVSSCAAAAVTSTPKLESDLPHRRSTPPDLITLVPAVQVPRGSTDEFVMVSTPHVQR